MKLKQTFIMPLLLTMATLATVTYAQSFFGSSPSTSSSTTSKPAPGANIPVISPDDFKNTVNNLSRKNREALSQQVQQQMGSTPAIGRSSSGTTTASSPSTSTSRTPTSTTVSGSTTNAPGSPTTQPAQTQGFTGFGTGTTQQGTTSPSSGSSSQPGGLGIQY